MAQDPNANPQKKQMDASQLATFTTLARKWAGSLSTNVHSAREYYIEAGKYQDELQQMEQQLAEQKENKELQIKIKNQRQAIKETVDTLEMVKKNLVTSWNNCAELYKEFYDENNNMIYEFPSIITKAQNGYLVNMFLIWNGKEPYKNSKWNS
eukprot:CAMPEP_0201575934 /NCGR_PEP_ID=MMETSP0190_2-20130828/21392_1 /ASSEMBLY_ACC=CAM_ASM_000263 /TAXON_ID=37353 /ORGANISM="Rosalina sp." /LENGTH=152 /DNA_ID=CAMNT_0048006149 /DNA_START=78 /DNA_END=533 /DNA_ORIENTATION=-